MRGSGRQSREVVGCSALGTEEGLPQGWGHNLSPVGMSPWRGGCHRRCARARVGVLGERLRLRGAKGLLLPMEIKWWMEKMKEKKAHREVSISHPRP